jgi:lysyl-tRNA synthetase class 2
MIRLDRNVLGPRVYVLGRRVHEWQVGMVVIAAAFPLDLAGWTAAAIVTVLLGAWLVAKDWRDLVASKRDTARWSVALHRRANELRAVPRGSWLAPLSAGVAAIVAIVNLASALTPNVAWRGNLLLQLEPADEVPLFHALAVPASAGLLVIAFQLGRRRARAQVLAIGLLGVLAVLNLLKGLDYEEASLSLAVAGLLWWARDAFRVRHDPVRPRGAFAVAAGLLALSVAVAAAAAIVAAPAGAGWGVLSRETADLVLWTDGPIGFHGALMSVPLGVGILSGAAVLLAGYLVFRPLAAPRRLPDPRARRAAARIVREHGTDTLSFFKLRADAQYLFDGSRQAFLAYRIENRVLLVSGDPVGPPESLGQLVRETCRFAELRGLKVGVVGASEHMLELWRAAGLHGFYLGDEAVVETASFSLDGRAIRKVRQSATRLERAGYRVDVAELGELEQPALAELERISERWLAGEAERGFSMAMDALGGEHQRESLLTIARDAEGVARGFIQFVPVYGRAAVSLSSMRRDRETPNGLSEFLVARSIELLRTRGIDDVSLNFAAFRRLLESPCCRSERCLRRLVGLANPYFQIESLYRFNAKFFPRWEPRYLVYEGALGLLRTGLAAVWVEGQLPKPRLVLRPQ